MQLHDIMTRPLSFRLRAATLAAVLALTSARASTQTRIVPPDNNYKPAHRRAMAWRVAEAKQAETRARRAVTLAERLARGQHPFRAG